MDLKYHRFLHIPERLWGLVDIAYNLWWSWHPEAKMLFKQLNRQAWDESIHNPVKMLRELPAETFDAALRNAKYLHHYDIVMARFKRMKSSRIGWFREHYPKLANYPIAYFSAEYGLQHSLPFYAGGLGFLAGDHVKECSDLGIPLVAVGFMYSDGYLHQHIRPEGWQDNIVEKLERDLAPISRVLNQDNSPIIIKIPFIDPTIYVTVWKVDVGTIPLYLLDTDIEINDQSVREISSRLYTGDKELRLRQEIVLGIGGTQLLNALGIKYSAMHLNEGHPAFAPLERIRERVEEGVNFNDASEIVRKTTIFTTHTPVPAGHDLFPFEMMDKYFHNYYNALGLDRGNLLQLGFHPLDPDAGFNMTAFAIRMSGYHNGVSKRHGEVAREMWQSLWHDIDIDKVPIDYITNGAHLPTWLNPKMEYLINTYLGPSCPHWMWEHDDPALWELIDEIPDEDLWRTHYLLKVKLINRIREHKRRKWMTDYADPMNVVAGGALLDPSALTIGFARRFSTYKRADLIFTDIERLKKIINNRWRPVQFIFAGKAHPNDDEGKRILQKVYNYAHAPEFGGRVAFIEDYGEQIAQYLVHGVDVWMNNPLPPLEASGTSGMKAGFNGIPHLSILDGWWPEAFNNRNGWAFGGEEVEGDRTIQDSNDLYEIIENKVVPLYYSSSREGIPLKWVKMMKECIKTVAPFFSARRMVKEYATRYYAPTLESVINEMKEDGVTTEVCNYGP